MPLRPSRVTTSPARRRARCRTAPGSAIGAVGRRAPRSITRSPRRDRPAHLRIGADLLGRAGRDGAAIDQHGDAVGEREHGVHVVLDQEDGALPLSAAQEARSCAAIPRAPMPAIGSSSSSSARLAGQRHGDFELALLAVREDGRRRHRRARRARPRAACRAGSAQARRRGGVGQKRKLWPVRLHRERHVLERA